MRKFMLAVVATAVSCALAQAFTIPSFVSVATYQQMSRQERVAYMEGLHDMMVRSCMEVYGAAPDSEAAIFCRRMESCTRNMTSSELTDFVEAFLTDIGWPPNNAMSSAFRAALNVKCPGRIMS